MGRGVRTVQRWERQLGLPVHRVGDGPRSPVFAFAPELKLWLSQLELRHPANGEPAYHPRRLVYPNGTSAVARVLVHRSAGLVHQLSQSVTAQRQRAERLAATLEKMRNQVRRQSGNQHAEAMVFRTPLSGLDGKHRDGKSPNRRGRR
jgi:hypothetical protein